MANKDGTTLIELMLAVILLSILLTTLYYTYSGSQKQAQAVMQAHQTNDELQRLFDKITNDLRESNFVLEGSPPKASLAQAKNLKTEDPANYLAFQKVTYDFSIDPKTLGQDDCIYTQLRVIYKLEKADPSQATGPYILCRETLPFDNKRQPITGQQAKTVMMEDLDELVFYRLNEPNLPTNGCVCVRAKLSSKGGNKYASALTTYIKERGAEPQ